MNLIPIQVTDEGVLIPKSYLNQANAVEVTVTEDYVLVKPKQANGTTYSSSDAQRQAHFEAALEEIRQASRQPLPSPGLTDKEIVALVKAARKKRNQAFNDAHRS